MKEKDTSKVKFVEVDLTGYCASDADAVRDALNYNEIPKILTAFKSAAKETNIELSMSMFYAIQMAVFELYISANKRASDVAQSSDIPPATKKEVIYKLKKDLLLLETQLNVVLEFYKTKLHKANERNKQALN